MGREQRNKYEELAIKEEEKIKNFSNKYYSNHVRYNTSIKDEINALQSAMELRILAADEISRDITKFDFAMKNYTLALDYSRRLSNDWAEEIIRKKIKKLEQEKGQIISKFSSSKKDRPSLTRKLTFAFLSAGFFVLSLIFSSVNLTGFSILNQEPQNSPWFGLCFFACGLIFTFVYFQQKSSK